MGGFIVFPRVQPQKKEPPSSFSSSLFLLLFCVSQRKCLSALSLHVFNTVYVVCAEVLFGRVTD